MASTLRNIVVVGGSYVGLSAVREIARVIPETHRIVLIEPHSHFHHLFAFPRFAIIPDQEHKAFIPYNYNGIFSSSSAAPPSFSPTAHAIVQARVLAVQSQHLELDREWQGSKRIPFDYLALATGTRLTEPGNMRHDDKRSSVGYLRRHQVNIERSRSIVIVGGGAVGVQMATDLKEFYPGKEVTVVQSRGRLMPQFHERLHDIVKDRFDELGVRLITGSRIVIPPNGFPNDGRTFNVQLTNGTQVSTDFVILATGQTPNNNLLTDLAPSTPDSLINPNNGFIRVRPTLQFLDEKYPNMFAMGDIADTGVRKAARWGTAQAAVVARNIQALIEGKDPEVKYQDSSPAAIHITLGLKRNIVFRNPKTEEGQTEPTVIERPEGREDMGIEGFWQRLGVYVDSSEQYHL